MIFALVSTTCNSHQPCLWFVLVLGNIILNGRMKVTIFHKKVSSQHHLINVLSAVIHGFVPVWIDGVMCLYVCVCVCVCMRSVWFALRGAEFIYSWDPLRSLSWTLFKSEIWLRRYSVPDNSRIINHEKQKAERKLCN